MFAVIFSVPMFRFRGLYFAIATLVLAQAVYVFMVNWNGLGGTIGLFLTEYTSQIQTLYHYALALAVISTVVIWVVLRTRLGLSLRALRDDEDTAQEIGVSTFRTKLWVWVLSSFLIGMVGAPGGRAPQRGHARRRALHHLDHQHRHHHDRRRHRHHRRPRHRRRVHRLAGGEPRRLPRDSTSLITGLIVILIIRFAPIGIWGVISGSPTRFVFKQEGADRSGRGGADRADRRAEGGSSAAAAKIADALSDGAGRAEAGPVLLSCAGLTKRYGDVVAVSEITLEVHKGEVLGVIGPNGAGKSTLVGMLSGALHADGGTVTVRRRRTSRTCRRTSGRAWASAARTRSRGRSAR